MPDPGERCLKLLVVGSSHMTALQLASDAGVVPPHVELSFRGLAGKECFAIAADGDGIAIRQEALVLPASRRKGWGRVDAVVPYERFDGFVVVGATRTIDILRSFAKRRGKGYSAAYFRAALDGFAESDHAVSLAAGIARHSGCRVALTLAPLPARPRTDAGNWERPWREMVDWLSATAAARQIAFVPQPEETLERYAWTRPEFAVGSLRLSGREHAVDERAHMNSAYGAIALPRILDPVLGGRAEAAA